MRRSDIFPPSKFFFFFSATKVVQKTFLPDTVDLSIHRTLLPTGSVNTFQKSQMFRESLHNIKRRYRTEYGPRGRGESWVGGTRTRYERHGPYGLTVYRVGDRHGTRVHGWMCP